MGAISRRRPAADTLSAYRPRHHAERRDGAKPAIRHHRIVRIDAAGDDDRGDALPPDARLRHIVDVIPGSLASLAPRNDRAGSWLGSGTTRKASHGRRYRPISATP